MDFSGLLFFCWAIVGPIVPPIGASIAAFFAGKRSNKFFYYVLNGASIITTSFCIFIVYYMSYATREMDAQDGLVFLFLPIWIPVVLVIAFLVAAAIYLFSSEDFVYVKERYFAKHTRVAFKFSMVLIILYLVLWGIVLVDRLWLEVTTKG
jgi:hypothetical protein